MSGTEAKPRRNRKPIITAAGMALIVMMAFLALSIPSPSVSANFGEPLDPDYYIKYVSVGVYSVDDIGTWEAGNDEETFKVNPDNSLNFIEVCVKYDPNGIVDHTTIDRSIFITLSINDGASIKSYSLDLYSNSLGKSEATFRESGMNYDLTPGGSYIISIDYMVVIK